MKVFIVLAVIISAAVADDYLGGFGRRFVNRGFGYNRGYNGLYNGLNRGYGYDAFPPFDYANFRGDFFGRYGSK